MPIACQRGARYEWRTLKVITRERIRVTIIGVGAAAAAAALRAAIYPFVGGGVPFVTFFPAVTAASLYGGTRSGTIATLLSAVLAPLWMGQGNAPSSLQAEVLGVFFFLATCAFIILAVRQGHWAKRQTVSLGTELAESEARFKQLANSIPQLAWMARPDGWIFWYNNRWYDFTGTTPEEMEGWGWQNVHDPEMLPGIIERWQAALAKGVDWEDTFPLRRADGEFRWQLSRAKPLRDSQGNIVMWFGTNTDITEQRRFSEERQQLLESERAARSNAERASFLKDEFLATLSHELRTPLSAILGWTQLLRASPGDVEEGLETIERNARAQTRIIEDLLEMSRIISGKIRLEVRPIEVAPLIDAAIESLRPTASAKEIAIEKYIAAGVPEIVGDAGRLQQVMWNLVSNAIKFSGRGGRVEIVARPVNSRVEVSAKDAGRGIAPDFLPYVFDRFRQEESAKTRTHGGLGLGLSIVKKLVELHGGAVEARSEGEGKGATFVISLPVSLLANETDVFENGTVLPHDGVVNLEGVRVLAVDDERDSREFVRRLLQEYNAKVFTAASADEALQTLARERADILVSDIGMPGKDGLELIRELRARDGEEGKIPAVALTAFARTQDRTRAMLAGYQVHLAKPVEAQELVAAIANLVGRAG